jgi:hypothetical protein
MASKRQNTDLSVLVFLPKYLFLSFLFVNVLSLFPCIAVGPTCQQPSQDFPDTKPRIIKSFPIMAMRIALLDSGDTYANLNLVPLVIDLRD